MFLNILLVGSALYIGGVIFLDLGYIVNSLDPLQIIFQNKCIEDLDCFYTGPPFFDPQRRPISLAPINNLKTKFLLNTPTSPQNDEEIKPTLESIRSSTFDPKLPVKVLVHGYRTDLDIDDVRNKMRDAFFNESGCNVITVDWSKDNGPPYPQAVANARAVGAQLAKLLNFIVNTTDVKAENIHIIGYSLGAHVAGWAGERIYNLGRITGLEPAGPYFQDGDKAVRLDVTDASFVDVIHTSGGENIIQGFGLGEPIGHMDFYPNGGQKQPGCHNTSKQNNTIGFIINETTKLLDDGLDIKCDHSRVKMLFIDSIDNSKCRFLAVRCKSYKNFEKGDCKSQKSTFAEMGYHARKIPGVPIKSKFFLRTNSKSPFCIKSNS